ncbi:MAG TPA: M20/M25/M40 family metallo-hydrolase [Solirubrobacteraceae bacterium]|nr:M20/M25/M40 family metallo-hydrolase [Solirubrobacteraceae bacterium]
MLDELERRVADAVAAREDELVALLQRLVAFDSVESGGQFAALQGFLAEELGGRGARIELAEPDPALVAGHAYVPEGFDFAGQPQLVARFGGTGGGRTLLLCGHVDVVSADPRDAWTTDPFGGEHRDGLVHGRGSCDMKGGVAAMAFAALVLADLGIRLRGDLVVNTVSEEETTGAGGLVSARTIAADAAIVPEPSSLAVWIACRGSLLCTIDVEGRGGHAGLPLRHPDLGGAVSAIDKSVLLLDALRRLNEEWALRPRHPHLSPANAVVTAIHGGEWIVSYPARCRIEVHFEYLPGQEGVQAEVEDWLARAAAADPWLREHPPVVTWLLGGVPPSEIAPDEAIVETLLGAERDLGRTPLLSGMENWSDAATLVVEAGIPSVNYGPGDITRAHTADEHVPVPELVACAQGIAIAAMRFCGVSGG